MSVATISLESGPEITNGRRDRLKPLHELTDQELDEELKRAMTEFNIEKIVYEIIKKQRMKSLSGWAESQERLEEAQKDYDELLYQQKCFER